jgi:hypothetical protein
MADDLLITINTDVKGVVTAIDKTNRLENSVKKLQKAVDEGRISNSQFDLALNKLSKSAKGYEKSVLDYSKSLQAAKKAQAEATAAEKLAKMEAEAFAKARKEATQANKEFDTQQKINAELSRKSAVEEERLKRKFIEGYAAMELYSRELNDLAVARKSGIISTEQQTAAVSRLNQEMANGTGVFSNYGAAAQMIGKRNNQMGVAFQQVGYQVGDFLVQIQSGTNPMVAFGQQATQLAGMLTMFGGKMLIIGSVLGVAIPLVTAIGAAFLRYRQEANKANDTTEKTIDVFGRLKDATESLHDEMMKIIDPNYDTNLKGTSDELSRLTSEYEKAKRAVEALSGAQGGSVGMGAGAATRFLNANVAAAEAALREAEAKLEAYKTQVELTKEARKTADALEDVADMELPFTAKVRILADMLGIAADEAKRLLNNLPVGMDYGDSTALFGMSGADLVYTPEQKETRQRAGGAGNVIDITQIIEARKQQIEQERILLGLSGQAQEAERIYFELLKQNTDATVKLSDTELRAAANLEASYLNRNKLIEEQIALQQQIAGTIQSSMETAFMSMVDGTATVKDAFRSMARDIIAELYRVLVVQQMVGAFDAVSGTGTGLSGFLGKALIGKKASGGTVMSNTPYLVGENGPEIVVPRNRGHVMNADLTAKAMGNSGAINVVNNINVTGGSDPAAIRMEVAKLMPQITNATKSAVIDARRRGGQMRAAFQ